MIFPRNQTKTRSFYLQSGFFDYTLEGTGFGSDVIFGVEFYTGISTANRCLFNLSNGIVYDYNQRQIATYDNSRHSFRVACESGRLSQWVDGRLISANENSGNFASNRFYFYNGGEWDVEAEVSLSGRGPNLTFNQPETEDLLSYTGRIGHTSPIPALSFNNFNIYDCYSVTPGIEVYSYPAFISPGGSGTYVLLGENFASGAEVNLFFDTSIGEFTRPVYVFYDPYIESVSTISLFGTGNTFHGPGELEFRLDYTTNFARNVSIVLETGDSYTVKTVSGYGSGVNVYQGVVTGVGTIYSYPTGSCDLRAAANTGFNTQFTSFLTNPVTITSRTRFSASQEFLGPYAENPTVEAAGFYYYDGFPGTHAVTGNIYPNLNRIYTLGENGEHYYDTVTVYADGTTMELTSPTFIEGYGDTTDEVEFPGGAFFDFYPTIPVTSLASLGVELEGVIDRTVTGRGLASKSYAVDNFFGYAEVATRPGLQKHYGTGTGTAVFTGTNQVTLPYSSFSPEYEKVWVYPSYAEGTILYNGTGVSATGSGGSPFIVYTTGAFPISFRAPGTGYWYGAIDFGDGYGVQGPTNWVVSGFVTNSNAVLYYSGAATGAPVGVGVAGPAMLYLTGLYDPVFANRMDKTKTDYFYSKANGLVTDGFIKSPLSDYTYTPPDPVFISGVSLAYYYFGPSGSYSTAPVVNYSGAYSEVRLPGTVFTGYADIRNTGINMVYNLFTGTGAAGTLLNFKTSNKFTSSFYSGQEYFPVGSSSRYIKVKYESNHPGSTDNVRLRVFDENGESSVLIYGLGV